MKVAIVGVGAIGSLWATQLQQHGHQVICFTRAPSQTQLTLQLDVQPAIKLSANQPEQLASCDVVLITVKSTQVATAVEPLFSLLNPAVPVIFLHNGMGAVDILETKWQALPLYLATTTQAAFKSSSTQVHHTGYGNTLIGPHHHHCKPLSESILTQLNAALPNVNWDDNIQAALWKKLAVNCVINPMTALYQCKNGEIAQAQYQDQLRALIQECHQVMRADGQTSDLDELTAFIRQVITATAQNYSSMYQDVHHQRPTEIDFITGFLLKKAQQYGIEVPNHQRLYQQIKRLEV
ncbi:2-dehydropantoate 2-reductase [Vibrio gangliei]|uniref:2-dehydropantoate 2-reductase n=1 Tax=Vibrio gangliei TaxID=2077090 RepID=UPI000D01A0E2|nr:2-dehydropantoate 2-reductase [Vibrio gangliei]